MNTSKKIFVVVIIAFMQINISYAQKCDGGYLSIPDELSTYVKSSFINKINNGSIQLENLKSTHQNCWVVYSDRAQNKLLTQRGMPNNDELDYMEPLVVKEVLGNKLHVFSLVYDKTRPIENNKDRGWIESDKVLLSGFANLSEKSIPRKAMILVSIANLSANSNIANLKNKFYNDPSASTASETGRSAQKFDIYYILKEVGGAVLLSKADKLSGSKKELEGIVMGWVPKANVTLWDHRVCLEPSNEQNAVTSYNGKELPIYADDKKTELDKFISSQLFDPKDVIRKYSLQNEKESPYVMRMPVLDNYDKSNNLHQVAVIASLGGAQEENSSKNKAETQRKLQETKEKIENVNILFVVDATLSMKKYYAPVANSIKQIINNSKGKMSTNNLRFGLVVYRDYADGKQACEVESLTSDYDKIINKVLTTDCFSADVNLPEAQYNGLEQGIKECGFSPTQSNIVVLIGDAGNHQPDPKGKSAKTVIDLLYKYQASLIAFQVVYGKNQAFNDFNMDTQDYLRKTAQLYVSDKKSVRLDNINVKNTFKLSFITKNQSETDIYMFGRFTYSAGDQPMDLNVFQQNVIESTNEYLNRVDNIKKELENIGSGNGKFTEDIIDYLKRRGFSEKQIEDLKKAKEITAIGNTSTRYYDKSTDCFTPVVFLSKEEKDDIDNILNKLINKSKSNTSKKKAFQDALLEQCKIMLGDVSNANILDKSLNDIWDIILSVPFTGNNKISNTPLKEISQLDDNTFDDFYKVFETSARQFKDNDYKEVSFKLGNTKYYWIPLSEIPGNNE